MAGEAGRKARVPYSPQRQQLILRTLRREGRVDVSWLANELSVTGETVRKDLIDLEARGLLTRVHGGAVPAGSHVFEAPIGHRTSLAEEKQRIARAALAELPAGGAILIDAGTTTARFAAELPPDRELTVFTNSLPIAVELMGRPNLTVYPLGGRLRPQTEATVGRWATRALAELNVDVAFLGTNGLSLERGLTTPDPAEAEVKALMLQAASRRVLLADHSKVGQVSLVKYADLTDVDLLITDSGVPEEEVLRMAAAGVEISRT